MRNSKKTPKLSENDQKSTSGSSKDLESFHEWPSLGDSSTPTEKVKVKPENESLPLPEFKKALSNKVQRKLKNEFTLDDFLKFKPRKKPNALKLISQKTLNKIEALKIVQHRGKKRQKKRVSTFKKKILEARKVKKEEIEKLAQEIEEKVVIESKPPIEPGLKPIRHSRNFRPYCDNLTPESLETAAENFVQKIIQFQNNAYHKNPERYKKRYLLGLKDAKKFIELKQSKLLIIVTDLEESVIEEIESLKSLASQNDQIPIAFIFKRRKLAYLLKIKASVSCLTVLNYEGAEELFNIFLNELKIQKDRYNKSVKL